MTVKNYKGSKFNNLRNKERVMDLDGDSDWPKRDNLPKNDPIGDIDPSQDDYFEGYMKWKVATAYQFYPTVEGGTIIQAEMCSHINTYKNVISNAMRFLVCRDCGADLGDI